MEESWVISTKRKCHYTGCYTASSGLTGGRTRFHGETSSKPKNDKFYKMVILPAYVFSQIIFVSSIYARQHG
jgi:hypothetical protein